MGIRVCTSEYIELMSKLCKRNVAVRMCEAAPELANEIGRGYLNNFDKTIACASLYFSHW